MVWLFANGTEVETRLEALKTGDIIVVNAGEMIPVDGLSVPVLGAGALSSLLVGPVGAMAVMTSALATDVRVVAPLVMLTYLNLTVRDGILIKDGRVLDLLNQVDTLVFDKTGTLTLQKLHVAAVHVWLEEYPANRILTYAAAAEYKQTHPVALAILDESNTRGLNLPQIEQTEVNVGYGLTVLLDQQRVQIGSGRFMAIEGIRIPAHLQALQASCHEAGRSLVMVAVDQCLIGAIELHATVRPDAHAVIRQLRTRFPSMYIISGDHEAPTKQLADALGIEHYFAETLPEHKAALIEELQAAGKSVYYVGDGINDAIALKKANVSISLCGASTIATDTAQVVLMNENLTQLQTLFTLAEQYEADMNKSLFAKMAPAFIGIPGAFLLQFNFATAIVLNNMGLVASLGYALRPLLKPTDMPTATMNPDCESEHDQPET